MTPLDPLDLEGPRVYLDPADAATARTAGTDFARALAGAPGDWFMLALGEQEEIIRTAIRRSGYGSRRARLAAIEFSAAAVLEWERIEPAFGGAAA